MECLVGNFGKGLANEVLGAFILGGGLFLLLITQNDDPGGRVLIVAKYKMQNVSGR